MVTRRLIGLSQSCYDPIPWIGYLLTVGLGLTVLLFVADAFLPKPEVHQTKPIDKTTIRILSPRAVAE